jgi:hypothetical protein
VTAAASTRVSWLPYVTFGHHCRLFSSLLGQGVASQWTASCALTFLHPHPAPAIASGVFFDGKCSIRTAFDGADVTVTCDMRPVTCDM